MPSGIGDFQSLRQRPVALWGAAMLAVACCATLTSVERANAETGTSGWVQRTTPSTITRPDPPRRTPAGKRRRAKSVTVPSTSSTKPTPPIDASQPLPKSTLGPIMVEPAGDNAAYIAFDQGQYLTALRLAKIAAERDDPQALTLMGRIYERGLGVPKDPLTAAKLYRRGAELGDTESLFAFAVMLAAGRGIQKNTDGAAELFERAARTGHPEANYNLGLLFIAGTGKPENPRRALMHIQYAAQKGIAAAQYDLAALYRRGVGTDADAYQATHWLKSAADAGMAAAQYEYAVILLQGRGFNQDRPKILDYLVAAARQGIAGAQNRLAHVYAEGKLVSRDMTRAAKWRLVATGAGYESRPVDATLDKAIAAMPRRARDAAQEAAEGFTEGARLGGTAVGALAR